MPDPQNPNGNWQDVPNSGPAPTPSPHVPPQGANTFPPQQMLPPYPPQAGYPPPPQAAYPPPPQNPQGYAQQSYPPPPPTGYAQQGYLPPPQSNFGQPGFAQPSTGMKPTSAAAVSYITFIPAVIFLLTEPYKSMPFVRFHSIQCLGLTVVWFAFRILQSIIYLALPWSLYAIVSLIFSLVGLGLFILVIVAIVKANKGEWFKLPVIGDFAMNYVRK